MDLEKIGRFLAQLRKEKLLSQEQLGQLIGVSNKTVSKWEKGNHLPSADMLKALSECYGVTINEILSGQRLQGALYMERAEENFAAIIETPGFSRHEKLLAIGQWLRKNWWAVLLWLIPAGCSYAIIPLAVSDKGSLFLLATSVLLTGIMMVVNHIVFYVSDIGGKTLYAAAKTIRIFWLVTLGVMGYICMNLLLALLHSLTPAGNADGYVIYSVFYDILIRDEGIYPDNCFNALEQALQQMFLAAVINLDLAVMWVKKK